MLQKFFDYQHIIDQFFADDWLISWLPDDL